jgi:hypothetical protein
VVIERDTKAIEVFALSSGSFVLRAPSADGWTVVQAIDVELRTESSERGSALHLRLSGQAETDRVI